MSAKTTTVTAAQIKALLAAKHAKDVFVAECKNGPSWSSDGLRIFDGWAMAKSWSPFRTCGYEVKVSRSDFERDQKWPEYLKLCHQFSFVCPAGLIRAHDLPKGVGLLWVSVNGERLHTKVKAEMRQPDPAALVELMAYVLMSRSRIVADMHEASRAEEPKDRLTLHRESVEEAERRKDLAYFVGDHVRRQFAAQEERLEEMRHKVDAAERLRKALKDAGVEWKSDDWHGVIEAERQIDKLAGRIPPHFRVRIEHAQQALADVLTRVDEIANASGVTP